MPRKKKKRFDVANRQAINEIPRDAIIEAAKIHTLVSVKIKRTSGSGQWASLKGNPFAMETAALIDVDAWLLEGFGGGQYHLEVRVANNPLEIIEAIPPFMVKVEGAPKVTLLPETHPRHPHRHEQDQPLDPTTGRAAVPQNRPQDFMSSTPDAIAMSVLQTRETELAHERTLREKERRENDARHAQLQQTVLDLQKQAASAENRASIAALEARLEALTAAAAKPAPVAEKRPLDWVGMAPILAPVVTGVFGVVTAVIESGKTRAESSAAREQKHTELIMTTLAGNKPADPLAGITTVITLVAPLVMPIWKSYMDARSPDKMADMMSTMVDQNLSQMSMMKTFLDPILNQEENPLVEFLKQGMDSLMQVAQHMVKSTPGAAAAQAKQVTAQTQTARVIPNAGAKAPEEGDDPSVTYHVNLVMTSPNIPQELKTDEWRDLLYSLHAFDPADEVAKAISVHLTELVDENKLPAFFLPIFNDANILPSMILGQFLSGLPAASINPAYVQEVLQQFDALFSGTDAQVA